jgi:hypothetical protein
MPYISHDVLLARWYIKEAKFEGYYEEVPDASKSLKKPAFTEEHNYTNNMSNGISNSERDIKAYS